MLKNVCPVDGNVYNVKNDLPSPRKPQKKSMFKEVRKREYPLRFQRSVAVLKSNGLLNIVFFPNIISANWEFQNA